MGCKHTTAERVSGLCSSADKLGLFWGGGSRASKDGWRVSTFSHCEKTQQIQALPSCPFGYRVSAPPPIYPPPYHLHQSCFSSIKKRIKGLSFMFHIDPISSLWTYFVNFRVCRYDLLWGTLHKQQEFIYINEVNFYSLGKGHGDKEWFQRGGPRLNLWRYCLISLWTNNRMYKASIKGWCEGWAWYIGRCFPDSCP